MLGIDPLYSLKGQRDGIARAGTRSMFSRSLNTMNGGYSLSIALLLVSI